MDLVTRFLAARRDRLLMRVGCWLVCFSLVLGLMLPQQRAEALVTELTMTAVASVAAAYLGACGMTFVTQGMDKDALVSSVQRLIQEFLDTELGGVTIQDWLGGIWDLAVIAGKIVMGRPLTNEFVGFAQWVAGKYGTQVGVNSVYSESGEYATLQDGSKFYFSSAVYDGTSSYVTSPGSIVYFPDDSPLVFSTGSSFVFVTFRSPSVMETEFFSPDGTSLTGNLHRVQPFSFCLSYDPTFTSDFGGVWLFGLSEDGVYRYCNVVNAVSFPVGDIVSADKSLSIDRAPSMSYVPEDIAAEQGIALDVGAAATMDLDLVCQGVLNDVLAGTLESTMTAADEKVEPIDPPAGEITDVDDLGLPALGQALTSRFPFSIPWDFFRAVQLLAAPAKAPYFEVDFMEPLADEVGGWKGSTKVVLDFSEYAIIGQISRWTSTIGFCLMLAGATKRLIWTA